MSEAKKGAWSMSVPIDRKGTYLNFELNELGIDEYMAVQAFVEKKKWKEAIMLFINQTCIAGDEPKKLQAEFDKNNLIPFQSCMKLLTDYLEPVQGDLKKN